MIHEARLMLFALLLAVLAIFVLSLTLHSGPVAPPEITPMPTVTSISPTAPGLETAQPSPIHTFTVPSQSPIVLRTLPPTDTEPTP